MAATTDGAPLSLRPMSLRPGGGSSKNPFERFAKGAGYAVKAKAVDVVPYEEKKRKPRSEVKVYERKQIESFQETNVKAPPELTNFPELQINTIEAQRPIQVDDRDWRGRAEQPASAQDGWQNRQPGAASAPSSGKAADEGWNKEQGADKQAGTTSQAQAQATGGQTAAAQAPSAQALKIQRAEDLGRTAWQKGASQEGNKRTLKEVRGILNKLTPEKFDTLSAQLIQLVTNTEVLQGTITTIFENAVAQPTFVVVYADLCDRLAKALPESLTGTDKGQSFKRILLNTCQEEFEGAAEARSKLSSAPEAGREDAERRVKSRTLGNIRLIAELFNKNILAERIVTVCVEELIGDAKADPTEDNVEALCELITKAGKKLEATTKNKAKYEGFFATLEKFSKSKKLPPRLRFMVRDVIDLRKSSWIPRRDVLQAKKIDEIHAEAHAELGMVPTQALPLFQALPALPASVIGPREQDIELFPAFRGGDAGWEASGKLKGTMNVGGKQHSSAFFLDNDPLAAATKSAAVAQPSTPATASQAPAAPAAPEPRAPLKNLSTEDRESRAKSLFSEYVSSHDLAEATACVQELSVPGFPPTLVQIGNQKMLDELREKDQQALADLLVKFAKLGTIPKAEYLEGLHKHLDQLEDLRIDVPVAPRALGYQVGCAILEGVIELKELPELLATIEEAETKRLISAPALRTVKEKEGEEKLKARVSTASLDAEKLFAAVPDLDQPDLPDVVSFLKSEGLQQAFSA